MAAMNSAALLAQWIAYLRDERRFAANSVEAYERDVAAFLGFLQGHLGGEAQAADLAALEPRDLRAYLAHRRQGPEPLSDRSISRALAAIRGFYRFSNAGMGSPMRGFHRARAEAERALPRPVSEKAACDLIAEAEAETRHGSRARWGAHHIDLRGRASHQRSAGAGGDLPLPETLRVSGKGGGSCRCWRRRGPLSNAMPGFAGSRSRARARCSRAARGGV